ncbi:uncharacterized protein LOC119583160 [Penaeus monodon]|uniref:uncharacterized protein LOC119583160 n=1 Tax=Penaeus monodon TaxID=6687 RepID=UPI0018A6FAE8|nr:uncharacterized protein LOC119583160 [Penaeus monodon]
MKMAILQGVQVEKIFPQKGRSLPQVYREEDREISSIKLIFERNECTLYKLEGRIWTELGGFHADRLTILKNGFKVTLETQLTPDSVDEGKRPEEMRERTEEASVLVVTLPQEQQE